MKKKKWFTLVEIIIVISIVAILMVSLKGVFQLKNKDLNYAQVCVNNIYGKINNFLNASATSKGLYVSGNTVFPNYYFINFDIDNQSISLEYQTENTTGSYKTYPLTWEHKGDLVPRFACRSEAYDIVLTWDTSTFVRINKWLQELSPSNLWTFAIFDNNKNLQITWAVVLMICDKQKVSCQEISTYTIDSRTQYIKKKMCIWFGDNGKCETRDQ